MTPACTLHVISGPAAGQEFEIDGELVIGRRDADLAIADDELSRRHVAVRPAEQGVVVEDLGSLNGTFVDGERIQGAVTLSADATVRVGRSEMRLRLAEVEVPEAGPEQDTSGDGGRTRLAPTVPPPADAPAPTATPEPEPIPQPQVTRVRQVAPAEAADGAPAAEPEPDPAPSAIPQPQVTRVRAVPDSAPPPAEPEPPPAAPEPMPQPQVTRVRAVLPAETPAGEPAQPAAIPQPQVTRVRSVASPDASGDEEQAKRPGLIKRLLARLRGGGAGPGGAEG